MYSDQQQAVTVEVTGTRIQKVGFRAMIQKMAIEYNVAGWARNNPNGTVEVRLQGRARGINTLLAAMRAGSKKSSQDNTVIENPEALDPNLRTFRIVAWTSMSRDIHTPYDLTFTLRPIEGEISRHESKRIWNAIALDTLQGEDRKKFLEHLERDDE
jgi:acylphosphatase